MKEIMTELSKDPTSLQDGVRCWFLVDDKLPEFGQGVIIHLSSGVITIGYRSKDVRPGYSQKYLWQLFGDTKTDLWLKKNDFVTHWMELPSPPTGI